MQAGQGRTGARVAVLAVAFALVGVGRLAVAGDVDRSAGVDGSSLADAALVQVEAPVVEEITAGPQSSWWERRTARGEPVVTPRPDPVRVADDLGAIDPRIGQASSPFDVEQPEFRDRRFVTPTSPWLVDPTTPGFRGEVLEVPGHVALRSTWQEGCPVTLDELRWVKVTHVGFDGLAHAGELLVHRDAAQGMVEVFRRLYEARYPIEKMRIAGGRDFLRGPWWHGDDNTTTAFVCRTSTAGGRWSEHAYGKAVDVNPYHNPYLRRARTPDGTDLLIPPGSVHYLERDDRPGIIHAGDEVWSAFREELGWSWGGQWSSALDYMHFSWNDH